MWAFLQLLIYLAGSLVPLKKSSLIAIIVYGILEGVMSNGIIFLPVSQFMLQATMAGIHKQLRYFYNQWAIRTTKIHTHMQRRRFVHSATTSILIDQSTNKPYLIMAWDISSSWTGAEYPFGAGSESNNTWAKGCFHN